MAVEIPEERYPTPVESAAYFVAAEALTDVAKYARASTAQVTVTHVGNRLALTVEDDGIGGAAGSQGSGLSGLADRMAALDGTLTVDSPRGPVLLDVNLPDGDGISFAAELHPMPGMPSRVLLTSSDPRAPRIAY